MRLLPSLFSRLALSLFVLLVMMGIVLVYLIGHGSNLYQQEVTQKLNQDLAQNIVKNHTLIHNNTVNKEVLDELFHQMMVINPSIELYLLDNNGDILSFYAPEEKVKRDRIDLKPIKQYLSGNITFPFHGDDPRNPDGEKIFSAAEIRAENDPPCYLYIILASESHENLMAMIHDSFILDSSTHVLITALLTSMLGGLVIFALLTRRLRLLGHIIQLYRNQEGNDNQKIRFSTKHSKADEIEQIGNQFNDMANRIDQQILDLQRLDNQRREMIANVSHDLRTPLATLRGYLETLQLKGQAIEANQQQEYLQIALEHSKHLSRLVEDLFELARLDACETVIYSEPFSMPELVQDIVMGFKLKAEQKRIELTADIDPNTPMVNGDIAMMQRVLENLIENALRHTPAGGSIQVNVDYEQGKVQVKVADSGKGIGQEHLDRIFERFYQPDTHRGEQGNAGLGLSIVKRILELHQSMIQVQSELERGTTFSFQLNT